MTDEPFRVAVTNYDSIIAALRRLLDRRQISRELAGELAGLSEGHLPKVLSLTSTKTIGLTTLFMLLPVLGCKLFIEEEGELLERMAGRYRRRNNAKAHSRGGRLGKRAASALARRLGQRGAKKLNAKLTPEQRSESARHAARVLNAGLTAEQRSESARRAVRARWAKRRTTRALALVARQRREGARATAPAH